MPAMEIVTYLAIPAHFQSWLSRNRTPRQLSSAETITARRFQNILRRFLRPLPKFPSEQGITYCYNFVTV